MYSCNICTTHTNICIEEEQNELFNDYKIATKEKDTKNYLKLQKNQ